MTTQVELAEFVKHVNEVAPMPAIAVRTLQMAEDDRSSAADLASIIATEQAMTAKLLRLANSAYFAAGREVTTVRDAVVLLGMSEIRRLILTTALMGRFTGDGAGAFSVTAFWGHGLAVGMIAEVMARQTRLAAPEEAFTAGILHDIGKLVMNEYLAEAFAEAADLAAGRGIPLIVAEKEVFGFSHTELGEQLADVWRLPPTLAQAIGEHHHDDLTHDHRLSYVVSHANTLVRDHGLWCGFEDVEPGATLNEDDEVADDPMRAAALARLGGMDRVMERVAGFLKSVMPPPRPAPGLRTVIAPVSVPPSVAPAASSLRQAPWAVPDRLPDRFRRA